MSIERKTIQGVGYSRENEGVGRSRFWTFEKTRHDYETKTSQTFEDKGRPHIICECGGEAFTIRYTRFACVARCVSCGLEETVYDG